MALRVWVPVLVGLGAAVQKLPGNLYALDNDVIGNADVVTLGANFEFRHQTKPRELVGLLVQVDFEVAVVGFVAFGCKMT